MIRSAMFFVLICLPLLVGCGGKPTLHAVTGKVTFKGKPIEGCKVILFPDVDTVDPDKHGFGSGITDKEGKYEIKHPQGETGIRSGKYKVAFLYLVDSKGKPIPADAKPSEYPGGAKSPLQPIYEAPSSTPESIDVGLGATTKDFDLK
jgi:hypothetical protein